MSSPSDITTLVLKGSLEISQQSSLKESLASQIPAHIKNIVLDFSEVDFIDSSCLGALIALTRKIRAEKGDIRIAALKEEVRSIFQITRLDKIFQIFDTVDQAQKSFS